MTMWKFCLILLFALVLIALPLRHTWFLSFYLSWHGCHEYRIHTDNFNIRYYDTGEKELKPLILVHGFLVDASLPRLKGRYRLILPDMLYANMENVLKSSYTFVQGGYLLQELINELQLTEYKILLFSAGCLLLPDIDQTRPGILASPPVPQPDLGGDPAKLPGLDVSGFIDALFLKPPPLYRIYASLPVSRLSPHAPELISKIMQAAPAYAAAFSEKKELRLLLPSNDGFFPSAIPYFNGNNRAAVLTSGHAMAWDAPEEMAKQICMQQ